ncbi:hypothetical protein J3A84_00010 [Proteiniclasticum sp. SCR006]|uniref:DUF2680 domain-containing protein n=1 Tax=Proteiniclasticum aestuarii TaxID=2817862 RepID=A0A939H5C0_9CLOT|nr:hypothetical protein [Proteiniclasticum aestuarii]MBO1263421.1 hypothetical protein [Proteiniclasticum aestuarii]
MKKIRNIVAAGALTLAMGITSLTVFAAAKYDSPQEALAGVTGKTMEEIAEERYVEGKTYGEIAAEADKLDEFKEELFEQKKEIIEERVAEGGLSREYADEYLERIEDNQATCFGSGERGRGMMGGLRFGGGRGR